LTKKENEKLKGVSRKESLKLILKWAGVEKNDSEQAYGNLGSCCAALGQKDEAIEYLEKSISLNPKYEPAIIHLEMIKNRSVDDLVETFATNDIKSIEYYKEYGGITNEKKSLIEDILKK